MKRYQEKRKATRDWSALDRAPVDGLQQLRSVDQSSRGLRIREPLSLAFVQLGPLILLALDSNFEELVKELRPLCTYLSWRPHVLDVAQVAEDGAHDASLLPGLATGGLVGSRFVQLPSSLWENPASGLGDGLNQQDLQLVRRDRHDASNQSFTVGPVSCQSTVSTRTTSRQHEASKPVEVGGGSRRWK